MTCLALIRPVAGAAVAAVLVGCGRGQPGAAPAVPSGPPAAVADAPLPAGERVENPVYAKWAVFRPGTTATQRSTKKSPTHQVVTTVVYRLEEKTDEAVTVVSQSTTVDHNGVVMANPPERERYKRYFTLPPGMARADYTGKRNIIDQGEGTVSAVGREFRANWVKDKGATEAGPMIATTWTSDEVPGGIIRSLSQTEDGKVTITIELTELTVPK